MGFFSFLPGVGGGGGGGYSQPPLPEISEMGEWSQSRLYDVAQRAVSDAVKRTVTDMILPEELLPDLVIAVNAFVHPSAKNPKRVHINNFRATRHALRRALEGRQFTSEVIARRDSARHPFAYNP